MSISDKAQAMIDELVSACIAFGRQVEPDWQTRIEKAQRELREYVDELEEQVWNLNLENERMEEAYWIDETITPDGTLKPSVRKLLERLEKAETDLRLSDDLVKALDNRIAELEGELAELKERFDITDGLLNQATVSIGAVIACCTYNSNAEAMAGAYGISYRAFTMIDNFIKNYNRAVLDGKASTDVKNIICWPPNPPEVK